MRGGGALTQTLICCPLPSKIARGEWLSEGSVKVVKCVVIIVRDNFWVKLSHREECMSLSQVIMMCNLYDEERRLCLGSADMPIYLFRNSGCYF